jgi:galactokinase
MTKPLERAVEDVHYYHRLFGDNPSIIEEKRRMLRSVWALFRERFPGRIERERFHLINVPNRVELLGKHTDYQGGETLLLTGPKNFFALAVSSDGGVSQLLNADAALGHTTLTLSGRKPVLEDEGVGSNFTYTVVKRLSNNLQDFGFAPLRDVEAVFRGDIPFGGGTSGSSAKLITDFLVFGSVNGLLTDDRFISLVLENGRKAGLRMGQSGLDDFILSLSMFIAHHENGLDFGDLKGDRGVGTFGGSEDHTAIILGKKDKLLFCRYCPTEVVELVHMPQGYSVVVAYSGRIAEKTKEAMAKYNRLSFDALDAVKALNQINRTNFEFLRDFFLDLEPGEKADEAYDQLLKSGKKDLAERAFQFYREQDIIYRGVSFLRQKNLAGYGKLINQSHDLSRKYLKNIVPEVDFLQKSANELGALGATGFGAGFGGSCYAVIRASDHDVFLEGWRREYTRMYPHFEMQAQFDVYPACSGCSWEIIES